MVPPGHGVHEESAVVAEDVGFAIDAPVVHETGVANRSPGDQDRPTGQFVVDHLPEAQHGHRICFRFSLDDDAHDQFIIEQRRIFCADEFRLVDRGDGIPRE